MKVCHVCDCESGKSWRCTECGADLAGRDQEGRDDLVADGGQDLETLSTHAIVVEALEDLGDREADNGIESDDVVGWITARTELGAADVHDAIECLEKRGEIYKPEPGNYRRTLPEVSRWSA